MSDFPVYSYIEMMDDEFPFKVEVRTPADMNRVQHAHEHLQLCYMMSGSCRHVTNNRSYILTKGDLFSIPPYQEHRLEVRESMEFVLVQIDFMPHVINENLRDLTHMQTFMDFAYIRPLISQDDLIPKMSLPPSNQLSVESLLEVMMTEWTEKEDGFRLAIKAELLKLLVITGRQYARYSENQGQQEHQSVLLHREALHQAIAYMESHYHEDLHLENVAGIAYMSPSYFSSMLRLIKGKSYIEYLSAIRMQAAMELLRSTGLHVTEIASRTGYNHISHFNRMFKKHTGVTPRDFRKHPSYSN
ncbi:helix-turn-helix domain-containing protein [Paenibacillus sp. HB172176]|uniref:AraC family transcriptional regulator n=1 Tax=Paenibacillus sp. HB172176 TaxID=2493690 RepID=UPI00143C9F55|nr:helix-turn-helix domain-containing protein [Paenibacillus sp. HB172176]